MGFGYSISGKHTYRAEGSYPLAVRVSDVGGSQANATATATVADLLIGTGGAVNAVEGTPFSGQVASFTDADTSTAATAFTASISWGDGSTSPGQVNGGSGNFTVSGSHTYAEEDPASGPYPVSVSLTDLATGDMFTAATAATVADAPLSANADNISAVPGVAFSGTVATFTDADPSAPLSDYSVTIGWGDGTTSAGTVNTGNSGLSISGSHTYLGEGSYPLAVTVSDVGGAQAQASATATVADQVAITGAPLSSVEGSAFSGQMATFTDADPATKASTFTANISWGDGTTSTGTVTGGGSNFTVSGSHTYAEEDPASGPYPVSVSVTDSATGRIYASATTATVRDAPLSATADNISAVPGVAFSGTVATFTDADPSAPLSDYSVTIGWGDGTSSAGALKAVGSGYAVSGAHTYSSEGNYTLTITVSDIGGSHTQAMAMATVADQLATTGVPFKAVEGAAFSGPVATFSDADTSTAATAFTASISWGDGSTSAGIVSGGSGNFTVNGSHTYAEEDPASGPTP